jgi:hypothetical protein
MQTTSRPSSRPKGSSWVAKALFNKGVTLDALERPH